MMPSPPLSHRTAITASEAGAGTSGQPTPRIIIRARSCWRVLDLKELWLYREVLLQMTRRDIAVRYKQTVLGVFWVFAQPLSVMLVFAFVMGRMGGLAASVPHYPLFVCAGILPWIFFANVVTGSANSVISNERLVGKIYFPRLILPLSALGAAIFDFAVSGVLLVVMMIIYQVEPSWQMLLCVPIGLMLALAAFGVGSVLAALIVAQRDFRHVLSFAVQIWMFATPAIYLAGAHTGETSPLWLSLNPAQGLIMNFRLALFNQSIDWIALLVSGTVSLCCLVVGLFYFRRAERFFADII